VLQESLTNIVKHANATQVDVRLEWMSLGSHKQVERRKRPRGAIEYKKAVRLTVQDDGHGFDPDVQTQGFGLAGMRERLQVLNGALELDVEPGRGLRVTALIPIAGDTND
jgi:signal transduction histidine kinase